MRRINFIHIYQYGNDWKGSEFNPVLRINILIQGSINYWTKIIRYAVRGYGTQIHFSKIYPKLVCMKVEKLKQCLEDITSVCILEGFQKQEHLVLVRFFISFI
jgi:hypothetical protein